MTLRSCCAPIMLRLLHRLISFCCVLGLMLLAGAAAAGEITLQNAQINAADEGFVLSADVGFELNPRLIDTLNRGVPLYFVAEFELHRPRWYWFDQALAKRSRNYRLSYHALTRQYRLSFGALHQNFSSLEQALATLQALRQWPVIDKNTLRVGETYEAQLRFRLDLTQLPATFQVGAIGNRDWNMSSDWLTWPVVPGTLTLERP